MRHLSSKVSYRQLTKVAEAFSIQTTCMIYGRQRIVTFVKTRTTAVPSQEVIDELPFRFSRDGAHLLHDTSDPSHLRGKQNSKRRNTAPNPTCCSSPTAKTIHESTECETASPETTHSSEESSDQDDNHAEPTSPTHQRTPHKRRPSTRLPPSCSNHAATTSLSSSAAVSLPAPCVCSPRVCVSEYGRGVLAGLGWRGGGLGAHEDGRTEPIEIVRRKKRLGLGAEKKRK